MRSADLLSLSPRVTALFERVRPILTPSVSPEGPSHPSPLRCRVSSFHRSCNPSDESRSGPRNTAPRQTAV